MRLSDLFKFDPLKADFIDIDLGDDLPMFVDPMLFWRSPHPEHHAVHATLVKFFEIAIAKIKGGHTDYAKSMCIFPEPENLIGFSHTGHAGHGMSAKLGQKIFNEIVASPDIQTHGLKFLNEFQLLIEGIGADLVSDMTVNISKRYFIDYTNRQCEFWKIPVFHCMTKVFYYDEFVWDDAQVTLPLHPVTGAQFILTPKSVCRHRFVELNCNQIYRDLLRYVYREQIETDRRFGALGKTPKVTWKQVEELYPNRKGFIVAALKEDPSLRHQFVDSVSRNIEGQAATLTLKNLALDSWTGKQLNEIIRDIADPDINNTDLKAKISKGLHDFGLPTGEEFFLLITDELNRILEKSSESLVTLLGSYKAELEASFNEVIDAIKNGKYEVCVIKNMPDIGKPAPRHKLFPYVCASKFVVILDLDPSGHLNEVELLKDLGKPIIIISDGRRGTTYMLGGIENLNTFYHRLNLEDFQSLSAAVTAAITWAEERIGKNIAFNEETFPWLAGEKSNDI
jgi:hypothetical protein